MVVGLVDDVGHGERGVTVGEGIDALLVPFLVIGIVALLVGVVTLRVRRRRIRGMRSAPPQPERDWPGAPVEPLVDRPVDLNDRWR